MTSAVVQDSISKAASAPAYLDDHGHVAFPSHLCAHDDDPIPTNPVEFHPDGQRQFDPGKRIYDFPNDKVKHSYNVHT